MDAERALALPTEASPGHSDRDDEHDMDHGDEANLPSDDDGGGEQEGDEDDGGEQEDDEDDGVQHGHAASLPGRWAFMTDFFARWCQRIKIRYASTPSDGHFGSFLVHFPLAASPDGDVSRRMLLYATELVADMLYLDSATWEYAKARNRWLEGYDPAHYDPIELAPTMTFTLSPMRGPDNDRLDAIEQLLSLLQESDATTPAYAAYAEAKRQIYEHQDPGRKLRSFRIPLQLKLQAPSSANAAELRAYFRGAVRLVRGVKEKYEQESSTAFRFDAVILSVYAEYGGDAIAELRALLSVGVPVTVHLHARGLGTVEWTSLELANAFPALTHDPAFDISGSVNHHTVNSGMISSSYELWSAVAYSSTVRNVCVSPPHDNHCRYDECLARWMGFALAHSMSLRCLELSWFRIDEDELDALSSVLENPVPASLLASEGAVSGPVELVVLKPGAVLKCRPGGELNGYERDGKTKDPVSQTLAQLRIPAHWQLPVVERDKDTQLVQVIVPGHGICEIPASSIAATDVMPPPNPLTESRWRSQLTELMIHLDPECETGVTGQFVELVGENLRSLHWGRLNSEPDNFQFDDDLETISYCCPKLEMLKIEDANLESIAPPLATLRLRSLSLEFSCIPMPALIAFFQVLQDKATPIAQTLQRFTFVGSKPQLSIDAVDAAVEMLAKNHRLYSITLEMKDKVFDVNAARFEPLRNASVVVEALPLVKKLAFLSVVRHHCMTQNPLGQLDSGCVASVFQFFVRTVKRRIEVIRDEE